MFEATQPQTGAAGILQLRAQEGGTMARQLTEGEIEQVRRAAGELRARAAAYFWSEGKARDIYSAIVLPEKIGIVLLVDETNKNARQWRLTLSATNPIAPEHEAEILRALDVPLHASIRLPAQGYDREQGNKAVARWRWAYGESNKVELPFGVTVTTAEHEERCAANCGHPIKRGGVYFKARSGGKYHAHCYHKEARGKDEQQK